jgi:predicted ATPase
LSEALRFVSDRGEGWWAAELHRLQGALRLRQNGAARRGVEGCFRKALDIARQQEAKSLELRAARDLLAPIYGWFSEGFDTPDLIESKALLEELR